MEATALDNQIAAYVVRSLLSEGGLAHQTVAKGDAGMVGKHLRVEGPTGLLVTTTSASLHPELETRLFSIEVRDDSRQTRAVLRATAKKTNALQTDRPDLLPWRALQSWLQMGSSQVVVPYADWLANNMRCEELRLRRDFPAVLGLVKAHAILHQLNRKRDSTGRIVADASDYRAVHTLVADILAESAGTAVPRTVRETVEAVVKHMVSTRKAATIQDIAEKLALDKSSAGRRMRRAKELGYLTSRRFGLTLGWIARPMPEETAVLPSPDEVAEAIEGGRGGVVLPRNECLFAVSAEERQNGTARAGEETPLPPAETAAQWTTDPEAILAALGLRPFVDPET
jgi:hypothetical protein